MLAPTWQYITMVVLFGLGVAMNFLALGFMVMAKSAGEPMKSDGKYLGAGNLFFRVIVAGFMMYVSYSLFAWYSGPLGLTILIAHWASLISTFIYSLTQQGRIREYSLGSVLWGTFYSCFMLGSLIVYGLQCL